MKSILKISQLYPNLQNDQPVYSVAHGLACLLLKSSMLHLQQEPVQVMFPVSELLPVNALICQPRLSHSI